MDGNNNNLTNGVGVEVVFGNGMNEQPRCNGQEGIPVEKVNGDIDNTKEEFEETRTAKSSTAEVGERKLYGKINGLTISKETEEKPTGLTLHSKVKKASGKINNEKPVRDNHLPTIANADKSRPTATSAPIASRHPQLSGKFGLASSNSSKEQSKHLKPLKQGPSNIVEEDQPSASLSPTSGGQKPRKVGSLPLYDFSFKCDERAEKRREFYSKLEEKTNAKEVEKTTLQAKSKESQEAEIRMLRKSLNFKATPMPSFYQEPVPPKVELKKIPTTRAKSPKLGRQKSSPLTTSDSEGSSTRTRPRRPSLDHKVSQNGLTQHSKKPLRKSLPKLPSEKSIMSNPAADVRTSTQHLEHDHDPNQEADPTSAFSQSESNQEQPIPDENSVKQQ